MPQAHQKDLLYIHVGTAAPGCPPGKAQLGPSVPRLAPGHASRDSGAPLRTKVISAAF